MLYTDLLQHVKKDESVYVRVNEDGTFKSRFVKHRSTKKEFLANWHLMRTIIQGIQLEYQHVEVEVTEFEVIIYTYHR